jgi:hypothetical protein
MRHGLCENKDLYIDILHGLQEMADDAWVEDTVLAWADKYLEDPASICESEKAKMDQAIWDGIVCLWDRMTATVTSQKRVPFKKMQFILRETYKTLTFFHREDRVPKGVANILLYMDNFLYQVAASEGPVEGCIFGILFDHYALIHDMITALKEGFLAGDYKTAYPVLTVQNCHKKAYLFDMLNDSLKELAEGQCYV